MAHKARYYGISTKEERQDMEDKSRAARIYPETLGYRAVVAALLNFKDVHGSFGDMSATDVARKAATLLTNTGLYGQVISSSSRVIGENYSIAINKNRDVITPSKSTEKNNDEYWKKKRGNV